MASETERLNLYKVDPATDGNQTFNIETMLNENWNKIDDKVALVDANGEVVNKDGTPAGGVQSVNEKKGIVTINKTDVGLGNVSNVAQASKTEFDNHKDDRIKHVTTEERSAWNNKVDTVTGKGLSTEDYTTIEKSKLAGVEAGANKYVHPSTHPATMIVETSSKRFVSDTEKENWNGKETPEGVQQKIDEHALLKNNPHSVTKGQVGLSNVENYSIATQAEAEAGSSDEKYMTPAKTTIQVRKMKSSGDLDRAYNTENEKPSNVPYGVTIQTAGGDLLPEIVQEFLDSIGITVGELGTNIGNIYLEREYYRSGYSSTYNVMRTVTFKNKENGKILGMFRQLGVDFMTWGDWVEIYLKPSTGIPKKDLAEEVESILDMFKFAYNSVQIGFNADTVSNSSAIAIGHNAKVTRRYGIAHGLDSQAADTAVAIGRGAKAIGTESLALGYLASVTNAGSRAISLGRNSTTSATSAVAIGYNTEASGESAVAIGYGGNAINAREGVLGGSGVSPTNKWIVPGSFTVQGTKNFEMPHPHPDKKHTHMLRHSAVESPTAGDNLYRFTIKADQDNQTVEMQLPDYFQYLNKDVDVWVNGHLHFGRAFGVVEGDVLKVTCEKSGEYKVLVIGTRKDDHQSVQDWDIKGVEREIGESWTGETYVFEFDEIMEVEEIQEVM